MVAGSAGVAGSLAPAGRSGTARAARLDPLVPSRSIVMGRTAELPGKNSERGRSEMPDVIEYRTWDKSGWGAGPWQEEPDKRQWVDEGTGLPCLLVRGPQGALCGYVGVSGLHPAHGFSASTYSYEIAEVLTGKAAERAPVQAKVLELEAHGGVSFAHGCGHGDPATSICHIPEPGEPDDVWWFGFDCAHSGDFCPKSERIDHPVLGLGKPTGWGGMIEYRDAAYVTEQCASLAAQLKAMEG